MTPLSQAETILLTCDQKFLETVPNFQSSENKSSFAHYIKTHTAFIVKLETFCQNNISKKSIFYRKKVIYKHKIFPNFGIALLKKG